MKPFRYTPRPMTWDINIVSEVIDGNVYRVPAAFAPDVTVLDLGAHIGAFTHLALECGATRVIAVEADEENYDRLRVNFAGNARVTALHAAVWRSDAAPPLLSVSAYSREGESLNTGSPSVVWPCGALVPLTISLDSLLATYAPAFLKCDIEGAEWPVLYTSRRLASVARLAIEYHIASRPWPKRAHVAGRAFTPDALVAYLDDIGFTCEIVPTPNVHTGYIYATR